MGWTAAAIIGSAVVGGLASNKAASAQKSAAAQAGAISDAQYQQTREDMSPYRRAGAPAMNELAALYGLPIAGGYPTITRPGQPPANGNGMANYGRNGDTEMAHVAPGEVVVPTGVMQDPAVKNALASGFQRTGMDPDRYVVGGRNSVNPVTGAREFYSGGSAGDMDSLGRDFDDRFDRERAGGLGNRNYDGGGNQYMTNPSWRVQATAPVGGGAGQGGYTQPGPDDYYSQQNAMARFYESPDFKLAYDQGADTIERSAAARGGLFSGNTGTALMRYGMDYGGNLYNQYANRLAAIAGMGQSSAAQTGTIGAQVAGQRGQAAMYGGLGAAQGWEGMANSINAGIGNAMYYNYLNQRAA